MNALDNSGLRQIQQIVQTLQVPRPASPTLAAEVSFAELAGLDHCAHCPIENDNPLAQNARQPAQFLVLSLRHCSWPLKSSLPHHDRKTRPKAKLLQG